MTTEYVLTKSRDQIDRFVRKHVGNPEDREDVEQQIAVGIIRAHRKIHRENLRPYVYGICRNTVRNYYRFRHRERMVRVDTGWIESSVRAAEDQFDSLWHREKQEIMERAIDRLPMTYKAVVITYLFQECNLKQIAEILGLNHATARWRLHRAVQLLREDIDANGGR